MPSALSDSSSVFRDFLVSNRLVSWDCTLVLKRISSIGLGQPRKVMSKAVGDWEAIRKAAIPAPGQEAMFMESCNCLSHHQRSFDWEVGSLGDWGWQVLLCRGLRERMGSQRL